MKYRLILICFAITLFGAGWVGLPDPPGAGDDSWVRFTFKGESYNLMHKMKLEAQAFRQRPQCNNACLDTMSNRYMLRKKYVEIIRQDDPLKPHLGIAFGFEFDETNGEFPYTPAYAVMQLKNFGWGGVEFSQRDTSNFTGVSNNVSDDLTIQVDSFINNRIYGRFSGLLISGAGPMAGIDSGAFQVLLYRQ